MSTAAGFLQRPAFLPETWHADAPPAVEAVPDGLRLPPELLDLLPRHTPIVDLGCGTGQTCLNLALRGYFALTGVDDDPAAIERARASAERIEARPLPRFLVGNVTRLAFPDDSFGAAVMQRILTTLGAARDRVRAVCEARRILKPGGRLYVAEIAQMWHDPQYGRCYMDGWRETGDIGTFRASDPETGQALPYVHHYSERELVGLLAGAGFEIVQFRYEVFATRLGRQANGMILVALRGQETEHGRGPGAACGAEGLGQAGAATRSLGRGKKVPELLCGEYVL
jgi:ubiquinone/menaquinone biosynthesis C-methylase UbiE